MSRVRAILGVLVVCLAVSAALVGPGVVRAQSASISISVNDAAVSPGGTTQVSTDPRVGVSVTADQAIATVVLRVNGNTIGTFEPGAATFSHSEVPDLNDGSNEFTVVAKTADGSVASQKIVLTKDDRAPFIRFTSPFETSYYRDVVPNRTTVNDSYVTVSGELHDATGVEHITIKRKYPYTHANVRHVSDARWDLSNPSGTFSKRIFLGNGTNEVSIRVEDVLGHSRQYDTEFVVTDDQKPQIDLTLPKTTHRSTLELSGEVSDNVQVDSVTTGVKGVIAAKSLFDGINDQPDESAVRVRLDGSVRLRPGVNNVTVTATDLAGNTVTDYQKVDYEPTVVPVVEFDREATRFTPNGTLQVSGVVTDGKIRQVTVESDDATSGDVVDLAQVYAGPDVTNEVSFSNALALADGRTRIVVRATDSNGDEHKFSFFADPTTKTIDWGQDTSTGSGTQADNGTPTASGTGNETATPTATPTPAKASKPTTTSADSGPLSSITSLPGFTGVTAVAALAVVAALAILRRRTR